MALHVLRTQDGLSVRVLTPRILSAKLLSKKTCDPVVTSRLLYIQSSVVSGLWLTLVVHSLDILVIHPFTRSYREGPLRLVLLSMEGAHWVR